MASGLVWARGQGLGLKFAWPMNRDCPATYHSLFEHPDDVCFDPSASEAAPQDALQMSIDLNMLPEQFWRHLEKHEMPRTPFPDCRSFVEAWRTEVRAFRPHPAIQRKIDACRDGADGRPLIGIHLRRTDVVKHRGKPEITASNLALHDTILLQEVRDCARKEPEACFFLACDHGGLFKDWARILEAERIPFIHHPKEWKMAFRQTSVADAVVDLWMLGRCRLVLATVRSNFVLFANAFGAATRVLSVPAA